MSEHISNAHCYLISAFAVFMACICIMGHIFSSNVPDAIFWGVLAGIPLFIVTFPIVMLLQTLTGWALNRWRNKLSQPRPSYLYWLPGLIVFLALYYCLIGKPPAGSFGRIFPLEASEFKLEASGYQLSPVSGAKSVFVVGLQANQRSRFLREEYQELTGDSKDNLINYANFFIHHLTYSRVRVDSSFRIYQKRSARRTDYFACSPDFRTAVFLCVRG